MRDSVLDYVNVVRDLHNLRPLHADESLNRLARNRARSNAQGFSPSGGVVPSEAVASNERVSASEGGIGSWREVLRGLLQDEASDQFRVFLSKLATRLGIGVATNYGVTVVRFELR